MVTFVCRTCLLVCQNINAIIPLSMQVNLLSDLKSVEDIINDVLPELDLKFAFNFVLCRQCWSILESWCKFRRKCIISEKVLSNYVKTQPVLTISDIVSKIKSQINIELIQQKLVLPVDNRRNVNSTPILAPLKEQIKVVASSGNVKQKVVRLTPDAYILEGKDSKKFENVQRSAIASSQVIFNQSVVENVAKIEVEVTDDTACDSLEEISGEKENLQPTNDREPVAEQKKTNLTVSTGPVQCNICHGNFDGYHKLLLHCKNVHDKHGLYMCFVCRQTFLDEHEIKKHVETHKKSETTDKVVRDVWFHCNKCTNIFKEADELKAHVSEKHNAVVSYYRCSICALSFTSLSLLNKHWRTKHINCSRKCPYCNNSYFCKSSYRKHLKQHTHASKEPNCPHCGTTFATRMLLSGHMRGCRKLHCSICREPFRTTKLLNKHKRVIHGQNRATYNKSVSLCYVCGKSVLEVSMDTHMLQHYPNSRFVCQFCGKAYSTMQNLRIHMLRHSGNTPYLCELCGQKFFYANGLAVHMRRHRGELPFECTECGKHFINEAQLKKHIKRHAGFYRCQCDQCGKRFAEPSGLKRHERVVHMRDRPYQCDICSRCFSQPSSVRSHRKMVHGTSNPYRVIRVPKEVQEQFQKVQVETKNARKYRKTMRTRKLETKKECEKCGKMFSRESMFFRHREKNNCTSQVYQCGLCLRTYSSRAALCKHKVVHVTEKNFVCDLCDKRFKAKSQLNLHKKRHEGKRPFSEQMSNCSVCDRRIRNSKMKKHLLEHEEVGGGEESVFVNQEIGTFMFDPSK